MIQKENRRKWLLEIGKGEKLILVLPRMCYKEISYEEWEKTLAPFLGDFLFIMLDIPEKLSQENIKKDYTIKNFAEEVLSYIKAKNLCISMIWGFSLGGMIAQELIAMPPCINIPTILISTNIYAVKKLKAIFSSWLLLAQKYGIGAYDLALSPWIANSSDLPILRASMIETDYGKNTIAIDKLSISLKAVARHDSRESVKRIKSPVTAIFGEKSVLLDEEDIRLIRECMPRCNIVIIKDSGMRVMEENYKEVYTAIKNAIDSSLR